ncbi:hypothetical protein GALMADRAFT_637605 [Galerina marginata CBS 339.88]|uniref:Uncharacterized protein n=1 Tax=Galerina marginata (strain CBS 339.88) TaxID=685588 RepID=A0A067TWG7_GALM3|nr:hypothetical protein GALMADRAFT_637605 [Galerina marginata CBS 339.88]
MARKYLFLALFATAIGLANAQANLTSTGCADAVGFQTCQYSVGNSTANCIAQANRDQSQFEVAGCACTNYVGNYNCYAQHCWNRVNECEYQSYIVEYLLQCPIARLPVPYFPAPDNAPDSCSCNLGKVYLGINNSTQQGNTCLAGVSGGDPNANVQRVQGCQCCELSGAISSIYGLCPNTNPSLVGLNQVNNVLGNQIGTNFSSCSSPLSQFNCQSDLGFPAVGGGTYFNPTNLPTSGTATLSNVGGTVTAPASGSIFTYTNGGDQQVYTISAASSTTSNGPTGTAKSGSAEIVLSREILFISFLMCFSVML